MHFRHTDDGLALMANPHGHVTNAVVCEDIRQEVGNRNTLVGVYAGDIVVREFPMSMRIAVYAEYVIDRPAAHEVRVRLSYKGQERRNVIDVGIQVPEAARSGVAFALPPTAVRLNEPGTFVVDISLAGDEEWAVIIAKTVRIGATASAGERPVN